MKNESCQRANGSLFRIVLFASLILSVLAISVVTKHYASSSPNRQHSLIKDLKLNELIGENPKTGNERSRRQTQKKLNPDVSGVTTIPHWSDSFTYQKLSYKYTMVGTDPNRGSETTIIPTVIIPIRYVFEANDGYVIDALNDDFGRRIFEENLRSPIFQSANFTVGGVNVGNTQYGDAFQRANFWDVVSRRSPNYHVLLGQPTITQAYEIFVPADQGSIDFHADGSAWGVFFADGFLDQHVLNALQQANVSPQTLPIVLVGPMMGFQHHGAYEVPGGVQTYVATSVGFHFSGDILGWLNNPFNENFTPGFYEPDTLPRPPGRCDSESVLDQLEAVWIGAVNGIYPYADVSTPTGTYRLSNGAFLDYFTRAPSSRSAGGRYSFFPITRGSGIGGRPPVEIPNIPSSPCTGHIEVEKRALDYPDSLSTTARGINNLGWIVGSFRSVADNGHGVTHGFIYDGADFTQLDYPDAVFGTIASKLNDAGQVVGWYFDADGLPHGFLYFQGNYTPIDFPDSIDNTTLAFGINGHGHIVGVYDATVEITHGFIYRNGQYFALNTPFALQTEALAINDGGVVVGDTYDDPFDGPVHGFMFEKNTFKQFDFPDAFNTSTRAVNNRGMHGGNITVFNIDSLGGEFVHSGYVTIYGYPYEVYANVSGMNDQCQIVGSYFDTDLGRTVGYVATLPK
jgi:uncharacterized membrane protein